MFRKLEYIVVISFRQLYVIFLKCKTKNKNKNNKETKNKTKKSEKRNTDPHSVFIRY